MLKDKYNMTQEQNIFLAKRNIVDSIYKSSHIEGIDITFPETQKIFDGGNVSKLRIDEIQTINNLKHAWLFVLNSINNKNDLNLLKTINSIVGSNLVDKAGNKRNYNVSVGGTDYKPEIPDEKEVEKYINDTISDSSKTITDRAITIMCYLMRTQFFNDGNKRTSMLFANKILIENGKGIISVSVDKDVEFGNKILEFYETNDNTKLKQFIYDECLDGIKE